MAPFFVKYMVERPQFFYCDESLSCQLHFDKVDDLFLLFLSSDYANSRCQSYEIDTNSRSGRKKLEKDSIVNFFEKICLRGGKLNYAQTAICLHFLKNDGSSFL